MNYKVEFKYEVEVENADDKDEALAEAIECLDRSIYLVQEDLKNIHERFDVKIKEV